MSTLDPACYTNYQSGQEVVDFFNRAVDVFKSLPSYTWLKDAGIVPSTTQTYTRAAILAALKSHHGHDVIINCKNGVFNELWYQFNVQGSVPSGKFVAADPVGSGSTCPASGIKYLPKSGGTNPPSSTTTSQGPSPTGGPSKKGYLYVGSDGFLISSGKWYRAGGTPATYTTTASADGSTFTLKSSKGNCAIQSDSSLLCGSSVSSASTFSLDGGNLSYNGASTFYATSTPSGQEQATVYTSSQDVSFQITFKAQ